MRTTDLHQHYYGVYLGTVLAVDDQGRVRVETDQLADTVDDPVWATVARPLAGDGPTVFFTPRERDQVLVSYIAGDPRQPVVLGYAHHNARRPDRVDARRHAVVTGAGRITFDEPGRTIAIERPGQPTHRITVGPGSTTITAGAVSFEVSPAGVKVIGNVAIAGSLSFVPAPGGGGLAGVEGPFVVNGQRVVLEAFLDAFNSHAQPVSGTPPAAGPPVAQALPGPPNTSEGT